MHYVYIIASGEFIKIGVSNNPEARLKSIKTGAPERPMIVRTRALPTRAEAFSLERRLHRHYRKQRSNGEWFRVNANEAARVMERIHFDRPGQNVKALIEMALCSKEPKLNV